MLPHSPDSPANGLVFTGRLPLAWRKLPALPDEIELRELERTNLQVLNTLFALDIHAGEHSDDPAALANASELKRLDFKLSLLLELVGQMFARQQHIPPERPLTLAVDGLSWAADAPLPPDGLLQLELYCNLSYPRPLLLPAQMIETSPLPDHGRHIQARFHPPSPALEEALERYIFLQHRRTIASQRRHPSR